MNYLLDTNICIYFLKGRFGLVERIDNVGFQNLFISEITIAELKYGVEKSEHVEKNRVIVNKMIDAFKLLRIYPALIIYAKEKARLRKSGNTIDDLDLLIGATAIAANMTLVTNNEKHFQRLQGIRIENWTEAM